MDTILKDNIQELYHASCRPGAQPLSLIANWSGSRIYYSNRGWGRVWKYFYRLVEAIAGKEFRLEKLKQAVIITQALFSRELIHVQDAAEKYQNYLYQLSNNYPVQEADVFEARKTIREWLPATGPFVKAIQTNLQPKLELLFRYCFGDNLPTEVIRELFASPSEKSLRCFKHIIDLEGACAGALPLPEIKKVMKGKIISPLDKKVMDRWINKIERNDLSVTPVHRGIKALSQVNMKKDSEAVPLDPALVEQYMEAHGSAVFRKVDLAHIAWKKSLRPGDKLSSNGSEVTLANEINPSASDIDKTSVYALVDNPNQVLVIGQNRAVLGIRNLNQKKGNAIGIEAAQFDMISSDGRWALMERLLPLKAKKWVSVNTLNPEDQPSVDALVELLKRFISKNQTPTNFDPNAIMLDVKGVLKALKPLIMQPFDFNALEEFIIDFSAENKLIYSHLMKSSELSSHKVGKFYHESLKSAFKGDQTAPADLAGIYRIKDPRVIDKSLSLVKEGLQLEKKICAQMRELFPQYEGKVIKEKVSKALLAMHLESGSGGFFWPTTAKEVAEVLKNSLAGLSRRK